MSTQDVRFGKFAVWAVIAESMIIYGLVAYLIKENGSGNAELSDIRFIFYIAGIFIVLATFIYLPFVFRVEKPFTTEFGKSLVYFLLYDAGAILILLSSMLYSYETPLELLLFIIPSFFATLQIFKFKGLET